MKNEGVSKRFAALSTSPLSELDDKIIFLKSRSPLPKLCIETGNMLLEPAHTVLSSRIRTKDRDPVRQPNELRVSLAISVNKTSVRHTEKLIHSSNETILHSWFYEDKAPASFSHVRLNQLCRFRSFDCQGRRYLLLRLPRT